MGIGASIFFIAVGAILAFAVSISDATFGGITVAWDTVGVVLMIVGALGLVWSLMLASRMHRRDNDRVALRDINNDRL